MSDAPCPADADTLRASIQALVSERRLDHAWTLADQGLERFPDEEGVLAITGLLALVREDWPRAAELLGRLVKSQGERASAYTLAMTVRALRCAGDPAASALAREALRLHPDDAMLEQACAGLDG